MKKILVVLIVVIMVFSLSACGNPNQKALVGTWQIVDTETETEYGFGLEFTKDGKLRYGLTEDMFSGLTGEEISEKDWDDAMAGLDMLMSIEYKVKSDTEMEITASAMFGLAKEKTVVPYSLDGDTLTFDGAVYKRVK